MTDPRSQPIRTCIGCRSTRSPEHLLRLHLDGEGRLRVDRTGPGRGAWVCAATAGDCLRAAVDSRSLDRALRRTVDRPSIAEVQSQLAGGQKPSS